MALPFFAPKPKSTFTYFMVILDLDQSVPSQELQTGSVTLASDGQRKSSNLVALVIVLIVMMSKAVYQITSNRSQQIRLILILIDVIIVILFYNLNRQMPKKDMASERPKNHLKTVNFGNTLLSLELFCSKAEVIYRHVNNELSKKLLT